MKRFELTFPGNPIPFMRPRFNKGRVYNDSRYTTYRDALMEAIMAQVRGGGLPEVPEMLGDVQLTVRFYRMNKRLADIDNLAKTVSDALQDAEVIANDAQIVGLLAEKFVDAENPRVEILLEELA